MSIIVQFIKANLDRINQLTNYILRSNILIGLAILIKEVFILIIALDDGLLPRGQHYIWYCFRGPGQ